MRRIVAVLTLFLSLTAVAGANEGSRTHAAGIAPGAAVSALNIGATSTEAKHAKGKQGKHHHKKHHKHGKHAKKQAKK